VSSGSLVSAFVYLPGGGWCGSLRRVPDESLPDDAAGLRASNAGLRAVVEAKDAENALLRAELGAARERELRLELRLAELERRLGMDSTDSGTPSSNERSPGRVGAPELGGGSIASGERWPEISRGSSFLSEYDSSYTEAII
jgi:hypothetical protein